MAIASPRMPRSIDVSFESAATVEQVHSTFTDEQYWLDRIAAFGGGITLDSLTHDPDGTVTVMTTQDLRHEALPGPLAKLYPGDLSVFRSEAWTPIGERRVVGEIIVTATGAPLSGSGTGLLIPSGDGSRLTFTGSVRFRLPLVGGKIENYLAGVLAEGIADIQRFTAQWIAEHP